MPTNRATSSEGFSLIELVLVLAIVSVVALMAVPRYGQAMSRYQLDLAARRLAHDLHLARDQARVTGQQCTIEFLVDDSQYTLSGVSDPDHATRSYCVRLGAEPYKATMVLADFGGDEGTAFNGFGLPTAGGSVVLECGGLEKSVVLDGQTGEVTLP